MIITIENWHFELNSVLFLYVLLGRAKRFTITKGYRLQGHVLETAEDFTLTQCCNACTSNLNCKSVNFDLGGKDGRDMRVRKVCELNGDSRVDYEDDFILSEDCVYAEVDIM